MTTKSGVVIVKCKSKQDVSRTKDLLTEKLGENFKVVQEKMNAPKIKIFDIKSEMSKEELIDDICNRNSAYFDAEFKILADFTNSKKKRSLVTINLLIKPTPLIMRQRISAHAHTSNSKSSKSLNQRGHQLRTYNTIFSPKMNNNSNQDLNCIIGDSVDNLEDLNKKFAASDILILHINIRSLNVNFEKLELLLKSLIYKPHIIVCSETRNLIEHKLYSLNGYSIQYNQSSINEAEGVIMYVSNALKHSTSVDTIGRCSFLSTCISINNNLNLKETGMYRYHDIPKDEFINNSKYTWILILRLKIIY